jgi:hypothetical protein
MLVRRSWTPVEAGYVLWHTPEEFPPAPAPVRFHFDVTLREPEALKGMQVSAQLRVLTNYAEATIQTLVQAV